MAKYTEVKNVGVIEWAKVFEDNRDMKGYNDAYVPFDGAYTMNLVMDKAELGKLTAAGSQKKPMQKRLMDGEIVIKFERKHKVTNTKGEVIPKACGAPLVTDADGVPFEGRIGNGSKVETTNLVTTFKGQDGKVYSRTTLTAVKVLSLVEVEDKEPEMNW